MCPASPEPVQPLYNSMAAEYNVCKAIKKLGVFIALSFLISGMPGRKNP